MAQYAFARSHADRLQTKLFLDIRTLEKSGVNDSVTTRVFQLDRFNIRFDGFASEEHIKSIAQNSVLYRFINWFSPLSKKYYVAEVSQKVYPCYNKEYHDITCNTYLEGYWINAEYFKSNLNRLAKDFSLKDPLSKRNTEYLNLIEKGNSVTLHLRRGDFVGNSKFIIPSLDYYKRAIDFIRSKDSIDKMFFFSDDINWTKQQFDGSNSIFVEGNDNNPEVDIILMSKSKHNIIANSTFSWWGALLNSNVDKIIIAPKVWYNNLNMQNNSEFIVPKHWKRMD